METSNKEKLSAQIVDTRKEITELTESELKEVEEIAKQYGRDSWKYSAYLKKNFKHIGEEIPENIPFSEYHDYILRNFRITKPMKEWTDIDYKVNNSWQKRLEKSIFVHSKPPVYGIRIIYKNFDGSSCKPHCIDYHIM